MGKQIANDRCDANDLRPWLVFWIGAAILALIVSPGIKSKAEAPAWRGVENAHTD